MTGKKSLSKVKSLPPSYFRAGGIPPRMSMAGGKKSPPQRLADPPRITAEKVKNSINFFKFLILIYSFTFYILHFAFLCYAEDSKAEPITVNGETVEYSIDGKEVTVRGNAEVIYKDTKLTCQKLTINTGTKDAVAEGNARIEDKQGVIGGVKLTYNFQTKVGTIIDSEFRSNPYFGKAERVRKLSEAEFIALRGYMTTCSLDNPHYRMKIRKVDFFPGDKVQMKDMTFYLSRFPIMYVPQFNRSFKDPLMHVQLMPGTSKQWGPYMLSAWRYNLTENLRARIYLDYRGYLGVAEGVGVNYTSQGYGKGDFKYYYTQERDKSKDVPKEEDDPNFPRIYQRYFVRWRHQWDIDERTNLTSEYYKIVDSKRFVPVPNTTYNILKDYFPREYELDPQPLSYATLHHNFSYASLDFFMQKRINRWYSQEEKLPEIKYSLPSVKIGETPFYFDNSSSYLNYNYKHAVPSPSSDDITYNRFDTINKFSVPMKVAFIQLTPFISGEPIYTDNSKDVLHRALQVIFSTGSDASTKFYRIFNVETNFLGLDINNLRHIITPTAGYSYIKTSLMPSDKARFGGGASIGNTSIALELDNKLQTKRKDTSVDLLDFRVTSSYAYKPKTGEKRGSSFSDFLFNLELLPYSWLSIIGDATYKHSGARDNPYYGHFSGGNYSVNLTLGKDRFFGFGQRYLLKGANELTFDFNWRINPKWYFSVYERFRQGHDPALKRGLREQEYVLTRDLHCWTTSVTYNVKRGEGESIWLVFRLKAFPEMEFEINQSYHQPKPGSQSEPNR